MRLPYSWLREVVAVGASGWDVTPGELEQTLLRIGHEVEEVIPLGPVDGPVTVGRVADIEELTGYKKPIRACAVDIGDRQYREIICGATNFAVGDLVVVALPGATLPGGFTISARKAYGRNSDGMICSAAELNLGADHSGILVLPPGAAEPGADGAGVLGLDDVVFHLAITPDRGYCMSVRGLARELACAYDLDFVDPASNSRVPPLPIEGPAWPLTVQPETGVRRFALRPVIGIDPAAVSPWWLQRRLLLCGIRATCPAVDVTNYVMLELGHPMHAHDRNRISGTLGVRFARSGETAVTLDGIERKLDTADVLIVDDAATAAIGGVMGAPAPKCGPTPPMSCWRPRYGTRLRYRVPSGGCTCLARPPVVTSGRWTRPSPWPLWTGAQGCSPTSPGGRFLPPLPTGGVTRRVMTGHRRRSGWESMCRTASPGWPIRRALLPGAWPRSARW